MPREAQGGPREGPGMALSCKRLHQSREAQGRPRHGPGKSREVPGKGLRESEEEPRQDLGRPREGTGKAQSPGWE